MGCEIFNSQLEGLERWKKTEDPWRVGEHSLFLCHTNPFKPLQKLTTMTNDDRQSATGNNPNIPQQCWWDNPQSPIMTRNSIHNDDGTTQHLLAGWVMDACSWRWRQYRHQWCTHPMPAPHPLVTTTQHAQHPTTWKPLLYSSEQLLNVWNVGAIKGVTSGIWVYCVGALVVRCPVYCGTLVNTVGVVYSYVRCIRVRVVSIPLVDVSVSYTHIISRSYDGYNLYADAMKGIFQRVDN